MSELKNKKTMPRPNGRGPMSVNLDKAKDSKATIKRLLKYLNSSKKYLILVMFFIVLYVLLNIMQSLILQPIIDDYIVPLLSNPEVKEYKIGCIRMIIVLIIVSLATGISSFVQSKIMIEVSQNTVKKLRDDVFKKIEKLPIIYSSSW